MVALAYLDQMCVRTLEAPEVAMRGVYRLSWVMYVVV